MGRLVITSLEEQFEIARKQYKELIRTSRRETIGSDEFKAKIFLIAFPVAIIVIGIIIGVSILIAYSVKEKREKEEYASKFALDNIVISVTKKENDMIESKYYNGRVVTLYLDIQNNSVSEKLTSINGWLYVYLGEDTSLMSWDTRISCSIDAGNSGQVLLNFDSDNTNMQKFYNASFDDLKLTFKIEQAYLGGYKINRNHLDVSPPTVIKPYNSTNDLATFELNKCIYTAEMQTLFAEYKGVAI